jgi:hypothetical protein
MLAMGRELDGLIDSVDDPAQDNLSRAPASIAFHEFLEGDSFIVVVARLWAGKDIVDGGQQVVATGAHALWSSLAYLDEVVCEDVGVAKGTFVGAVGWRSKLFERVVRVPETDAGDYCQDQVGQVVRRFSGAWLPGKVEVILH